MNFPFLNIHTDMFYQTLITLNVTDNQIGDEGEYQLLNMALFNTVCIVLYLTVSFLLLTIFRY